MSDEIATSPVLPVTTEVPLVLTGIHIDAKMLKAKGACSDGFNAFVARWPSGCDYQVALHWLSEIDRACWAGWLMHEIGSAQTETVVEGSLKVGSVFVAGRLVVRGSIEAGQGIKVGSGIKAGSGIKSGRDIKAGRGINAGECIQAGRGIQAGECIKAGSGITADWGIEAGKGIKACSGITAGWGIEAGCGIKAGEGITAGWGIEAGCGIKAGEGIEVGWGVKAGKGIQAAWIDCAMCISVGLAKWRLPEQADPADLEIRAVIRRGIVAQGVVIAPSGETTKVTSQP